MKPTSTDRWQRLRRGAWLVLAVAAVACEARAGDAGPRWPAGPEVKLTAAGESFWGGGASEYFASLTGSVAWEFDSSTKPRKAGVFAAYRAASGDVQPDALQAVGWVSADFSRWQTKLFAGYVDPRRGAGHLLYIGKLRFRIAEDHWLGLEAMGRAGGGRPCTRLVYEGDVAGYMSLRVAVDLGAAGQSEVAARSEFVWRIR